LEEQEGTTQKRSSNYKVLIFSLLFFSAFLLLPPFDALSIMVLHQYVKNQIINIF
jgi:hypothetical protein